MNPSQRLQLNQIIDENNVEDYTKQIRENRHSNKIRTTITRMLEIMKANEGLEARALDNLLMAECAFMFNQYTDLYNRIKRRELDMSILWEFLNVLEKIENGEADQHAGAFEVGSLLKKLYIDSAVRRVNMTNENDIKKPKAPVHNISWKAYKSL